MVLHITFFSLPKSSEISYFCAVYRTPCTDVTTLGMFFFGQFPKLTNNCLNVQCMEFLAGE